MRALCVLIVAALAQAHAAEALDAAHTAWQQGRPSEALPSLIAQAQASQRWDDYYDCGICALAVEDEGRAIVALLTAHRLAPDEDRPRGAVTKAGGGCAGNLARAPWSFGLAGDCVVGADSFWFGWPGAWIWFVQPGLAHSPHWWW